MRLTGEEQNRQPDNGHQEPQLDVGSERQPAQAGTRSSLLHNFAAMFAWQGMNYLLPLITLPYLARTLGPHQYGVLGFAASVMAYFSLLTNWGFGLSATQQVAANRGSPAALTEIFWNTMFAKSLLGLFSLMLLTALVLTVPDLHPYALVLFLSWIQVLASVFTADWYLQGMELMSRFATASVIGRAAPIPLVFLLVHGPQDVAITAALQSLSSVIAAVISLRLGLASGGIGHISLSLRRALHHLRTGAELFLSQAALSFYSNLNAVVVAAVAGPVQAGLFVGSDKIRNAVQGLTTPISLVMYPRLANMVATDRSNMFGVIRKLAWFQGGFTACLSVGTWLFAPLAVRILLGPQYAAATDVLRALAPVPFLVGVNSLIGVQIMLPLGMRREFLVMVALPAVFSLAYMPLLAYGYGAVGVATALSVTELIVNLIGGVLLYWRRHRLHDGALAAVPS